MAKWEFLGKNPEFGSDDQSEPEDAELIADPPDKVHPPKGIRLKQLIEYELTKRIQEPLPYLSFDLDT
jgi:hypothetical protein